jgi:hypothetical protein
MKKYQLSSISMFAKTRAHVVRYGCRQWEPFAWTGGIQSTPWFEGSHFPPRTSSGIRTPPWVSNLDRRLRTLIQSSPLAASETRKSYAESKRSCTGVWDECALLAKHYQGKVKRKKKEHQQRARRGGGAMALLPVVLDRLFAFSSLLFYSSECFLQKLWLLGKICDFFPLKIYFWKVCYVGNWFVFRESFADVLVFSQ